jgi:hypothetical protein
MYFKDIINKFVGRLKIVLTNTSKYGWILEGKKSGAGSSMLLRGLRIQLDPIALPNTY